MTWRDEAARDNLGAAIDGSNHGLTYYLRTNTNHQGATVAGVTVAGTPAGSGWTFTIAAGTTDGFAAGCGFAGGCHRQRWWRGHDAGRWSADGAGGSGLHRPAERVRWPFAGAEGSEAVQAAIRAIVSGGVVQEYKIGTRSLKKYEMADLIALEGKLKAEVKREQAAQLAANGLGNPHNLFVRF